MQNSKIQTGDIVGLCKTDEQDLMKAHVGIAYKASQTTMLIHSSRQNGMMKTECLEEVMKEYGYLAWIKRPVIQNPLGVNLENLAKLGLEDLA